jgi:hypothetical protein
VSRAWDLLLRGGVPLAGVPAGARPACAELASAALEVIAGEPAPSREREALAAWILAWESHWPTSFRASFGGEGARATAWARAQLTDENRFLKLRRIALELLADIA